MYLPGIQVAVWAAITAVPPGPSVGATTILAHLTRDCRSPWSMAAIGYDGRRGDDGHVRLRRCGPRLRFPTIVAEHGIEPVYRPGVGLGTEYSEHCVPPRMQRRTPFWFVHADRSPDSEPCPAEPE